MKVDFGRTFQTDLESIRDPKLLARLQRAIDNVQAAQDVTAVPNLKRLEGKKRYYRIRVGNYRIGFEIIRGTVVFLRCMDRKDIYRKFP